MQYFKKVTAALTAFVLGVVLTGCAQDGDGINGLGTGAGSNSGNGFSAEGPWQAEHTALNMQYGLTAVTDEMIYGCHVEADKVIVTFQNKENGVIERQVTLDKISQVGNISADNNGNVYLAGSNGDLTAGGTNKFCIVDAAGNQSEVDELVLEDTGQANYVIPRGIYSDTVGNYYVWYEMGIPLKEIDEDGEENVFVVVDRIYIKDQQFNTIFYEQAAALEGTSLLDFNVNMGGKPGLIIKDAKGIYIQEIDVEQKQLSDKLRWEGDRDEFSWLSDDIANIYSIEGGFLYCLDGQLDYYSYEKQVSQKILELSSYGIIPENITYLGMHNNQIEIIDHNGDNGKSVYTTLKPANSEKLVLTIGVIQPSQELEKAVTAFNRQSEDISVELITYYNEQEGYEKGAEQLNLDIISGEGPDLLEVSSLDKSIFADKGVLADLLEFMQSDTECSRDMLMDSVVAAYQSNDQLYSIAPGFQLYSMWGSNELIRDRNGISLAELIKILADEDKTLNAVYGFSADEPVLTTLATFGMDEFIDWDRAVPDFTGAYFQELLTFAREYQGGYTEGSFSAGIKKGEILFSAGTIFSVADYQLQSKLYGGDLAFIGYPTAKGSGTAVGFSGSELAINAHSSNVAAAWEFVKYYLLNGYSGQGFPIIKSQFDEVMEQAQMPDMDISEAGSVELPKGTFTDGDTYLEVFAAEPKDIEAIKTLVAGEHNSFKYNTEIINIINEEAGAYLSGQKDLTETTRIIQNRAQLYLQEQKR